MTPRVLLKEYILPAARSSVALAENKDAHERLKNLGHDLKSPPAPEEIPPFPETAARISGKVYHFKENAFSLKGASFHFPPDSPEAIFEGRFSVPCKSLWHCLFSESSTELVKSAIGLDGVWRFSRKGSTVRAAKGAWQDESFFIADYHAIDGLAEWKITVRFDQDRVAAELYERISESSLTLEGRMKAD